MRTPIFSLLMTSLALSGCGAGDEADCSQTDQVTETRFMSPSGSSQFYLNTPAAEKGCHADFQVEIWHADTDLEADELATRPAVSVAAGAAATDNSGEAGTFGPLDDWSHVETGGSWRWKDGLNVGAKNMAAPAVTYQLSAVTEPGEQREFNVKFTILYTPARD